MTTKTDNYLLAVDATVAITALNEVLKPIREATSRWRETCEQVDDVTQRLHDSTDLETVWQIVNDTNITQECEEIQSTLLDVKGRMTRVAAILTLATRLLDETWDTLPDVECKWETCHVNHE